MTNDEFLPAIAPFLYYPPDSANYEIYRLLHTILIEEGGDDEFAHLPATEVAFEMSKHVTLRHIEYYDNEIDEIDLYHLIKIAYKQA